MKPSWYWCPLMWLFPLFVAAFFLVSFVVCCAVGIVYGAFAGIFKSFRFFKELFCKRPCNGPNRFYGIMFSAPFSAFGKAGAHCRRYYSVRRDKGADGLRLTFSSINQICIKFKIGKFGYGVKSAASGGFNYGTLIPLFVFSFVLRLAYLIITFLIVLVVTVVTYPFMLLYFAIMYVLAYPLIFVGKLIYKPFEFIFRIIILAAARLIDALYVKINRVGYKCGKCGRPFKLPGYRCPECGALNYKLKPTLKHIFKGECVVCGRKLPTMTAGKKRRLDAVCPYPDCRADVYDGAYTAITIPVIGAPSSGKTSFIAGAFDEMTAFGSGRGFCCTIVQSPEDRLKTDIHILRTGGSVMATKDMRLEYFSVKYRPVRSEAFDLISLCDMAGEAYNDKNAVSSQNAFTYADGLIVVIDPMSLPLFREKNPRLQGSAYDNYDISLYRDTSMIIHSVADALRVVRRLGRRELIKTKLAIVFTKCDLPGLDEMIGNRAVKKYIKSNPGTSKAKAMNALGDSFLSEYAVDIRQALISEFKTVRYFSSSVYITKNGRRAYCARGCAKPVLWLASSKSKRVGR